MRRRTCSTEADSGSFFRSNKLMHFSAMVKCRESCCKRTQYQPACLHFIACLTAYLTFSLTSRSCGRLASMSFISFKLVPLHKPSSQGQSRSKLKTRRYAPFSRSELAAVLARVRLEIGDQLVQRLFHVHVSYFSPHFIVVIQYRFLVFRGTGSVLECISASSTNRTKND